MRSTYEEEGTSDEDEDEENIDACADYNEIGIPIADRARSSNEDAFDLNKFVSLDKMSITPREATHKFGGNVQRFMQMPSKIRPSTSPESL